MMGKNVYTCIDFYEFAFEYIRNTLCRFRVLKFATIFATCRRISTEVGASNLGKHGISRYESSGKGSGGWKYPAEVPMSGTSCWSCWTYASAEKTGPMPILRYP